MKKICLFFISFLGTNDAFLTTWPTTIRQQRRTSFFLASIEEEFNPHRNKSLHHIQEENDQAISKVKVDDDEPSRDDPFRHTETSQSPTDDPSTSPSGIAIILNANARGVNSNLIRSIQSKFDSSDQVQIFVTSTEQEARQAVNELQRKPTKIVIPVGGDGTLTTMLQFFQDISTSRRLPLFAYIPMGTGNALGPVIGSTPHRRFRRSKRMEAVTNVLDQLLDTAKTLTNKEETTTKDGDVYVENQSIDIVDLPLLQITTSSSKNLTEQKRMCCFFAGIGFDSLMLQDYEDLQTWSSKSKLWKDKFQSVWGYTVTLFTRTLPKCISHQSHQVNVELSTTASACWVDHRRGDVLRKIPTNESGKIVLYKGQAGIVAAATTPFYGGNLKLFPFARLTENGCQVRIGRIHPLNGVLHIPQIFQGTYRNANMGCLDFIGTEFTLDITSPNQGYPVQHSGESIGPSQQVCFKVMEEPVRFVTLLPSRLVTE